MSRFLDEARRLVARFVPSAGDRPQADGADADEAAVRQAFLSPEGIEPAPLRRRSAPGPVVEPETEPGPQPAVSPAPTRASEPAPEPAVEPTPEPPAEPETEPAAAAKAPKLTPGPVAAAPAAGGAPATTAEPEAVEQLARRRRRQAGATAPDHLLAPPATVDAAVDDFFDGFVRQVEGDR